MGGFEKKCIVHNPNGTKDPTGHFRHLENVLSRIYINVLTEDPIQ